MVLESLTNKPKKVDTEKDYQSRLLNFYNLGDNNLVSRKKRKQLLSDYWEYIFDLGQESKNRLGRVKTEQVLGSLKEAECQINELLEMKVFPIVSVSKKRLERIKKNKGIRAGRTWLANIKVIAGTFAVKPYVPKKEVYEKNEERVLLQIEVPINSLKARVTGIGKKAHFQGVVCFREKFIPIDRIKVFKNYPL